ncbi:MAG: cyclopropane-fatty-acyl-phospholipid synthase family protein [Oligoflexales bacterium]
MQIGINLAERGMLPDAIVRLGIRRLLTHRLKELPEQGPSGQQHQLDFVEQLRKSPIAVEMDTANSQHYEIPADFFKTILGPHLKYSSAFYEHGAKNLAEAELHMLRLYAERAEIEDGMSILDLGCGWGSLSLFLAKLFPNSKVCGVSNSHQQRQFILEQAKTRGIANLDVITCDMNEFEPNRSFDRVVSIEMFEHMRNYQKLLGNISDWLSPEGKVFIHIFCHKSAPYYFETVSDDDWMGKYFFTGGIMPSDNLLLYFQEKLSIEKHWVVNGKNYEKTSLAWLQNLESKHDKIKLLFKEVYGQGNEELWYQRWRIFFLSCAELFAYREGKEWWVSHYLFQKKLAK